MPLAAMDHSGRTLFVGTFGFSIHPSIRTAFIVVPDQHIETIGAAFDRLHDDNVPPVQKALTSFIEHGYYAQHLSRMRDLYVRRRKLIADAIADAAGPDLSVTQPNEGTVVVARLTGRGDDVAIATDAGLPAKALSPRFLRAPAQHGFVLGFANCPNEATARAGIGRLAEAIRRHR